LKLDDYLADWEGCDPEEALELLIDLGRELPPLSAAHAQEGFPSSCRIQECQTAVFLWIEAHVPEQSPTVRGFVALLVLGLSGASPEEVLSIPDDLLPRLGLQQTLGMTRSKGFRGIVARIKREAAQGALERKSKTV
jgi:cysteine desulfuration protein SufE